ncbi:MAG: chromate transporter [Planctomycetota bacterium]|nr:chromate transporter [Planctomycetota bacterium]
MRLLPRLFVSFFKIGLFTIGGGYAMLPLIEREVVERRGWLSGGGFLDALAIAQSLPGPVAVNSAVFVGYRAAKIPGAVAAILGATLPSFLVMLAIAGFFVGVKDNECVVRAFNAVRPAVAALIAGSVWSLAQKTERRIHSLVLIVGAALLVWRAKISPAWIVLSLAVLGAVLSVKDPGARKEIGAELPAEDELAK